MHTLSNNKYFSEFNNSFYIINTFEVLQQKHAQKHLTNTTQENMVLI